MGVPGAFFEVFPVAAVRCLFWTESKGMLRCASSAPKCRIGASSNATVEASGRASVQYNIASPAHPHRGPGDLISALQALTVSLSALLRLHLVLHQVAFHHCSLFPLNALWHLQWCCNSSWQILCLCRSAPVRLQVLANRIMLLFWLYSRLSLLNDKQ